MLGPVHQHAVEHRRVRAAEGDGAFARRLVGGRVEQSARQSQDGHEQRVVPGARQGEGRQRGRGGDRCSRGGVHAASFFQHASLLGEVHFVVTVAYSRVRRGRIEAGAARARRLGARARARGGGGGGGVPRRVVRVRVNGAARGERRHGAALAQRARAAGQLREPKEHAERRARRREARGGGGGWQNHIRQLTSLRGGETVPNHPGARHRARQRARRGVRDGRSRDAIVRGPRRGPCRGPERDRGKKDIPRWRGVFVREGGAHRRWEGPAGGTRGGCLAEEPRNKRAASASPRRRLLPPRAAAARAERAAALAGGAPGGGHRGEQRLGDSQRGGARGIVHGGVRDVPAQTGFHQARRVASQQRADASLELILRARGGARGGARAFSLETELDAPASLRGFGFFWKRFAVEARRDFFARLL